MTTLQQQARALGDPTRHGIFRYVADAEGAVGVAQLTAHFGLNHNAIRQHLAKLVDAELVIEQIGPSSGRGRPPLMYEVHPAAESRWDVTGPYERLTLWLSEVIRSGDTPVEVGRRAGRRQLLADDDASDPLATLVDQMARHGFDPITEQRADSVEVVLQSCPFESTALADPQTVCDLHLGFAEGVAEHVGDIAVTGLIRNDPRTARCRLQVVAVPHHPGPDASAPRDP